MYCCASPPSELEEALLVMPFSDVIDFLPLLALWLEVLSLSCQLSRVV